MPNAFLGSLLFILICGVITGLVYLSFYATLHLEQLKAKFFSKQNQRES